MILESLHLTNFGLYAGDHTFELLPDFEEGRPIILIRGHNGGGKTTFLEAVRLALYGKRALGLRISRADYEEYLRDRIYKFASDRSASVSLMFRRQEQSAERSYLIKRSWSVRPSGVVDTLSLKRDGLSIDDVPEEDWEHYLQDIIPPGVSQLFFFDGEKIQDIADTEATEGLRDAIRALLGLDLIEQLRGDLALYSARNESSDTEHDLAAVEAKLDEQQHTQIEIEEDAASLASKRDIAARRIERAQASFLGEGGAIATDRANLQKMLQTEERRIESLIGQLKRLSNTVAPLTLAPKLIRSLKKELSNVQSSSSFANVNAFIDAFETEKANVRSKRPSWSSSHFAAMRAFLRDRNENINSEIFEADPSWFAERLAGLDAKLRKEARSLASDLDEAYAERDRLRLSLKGFDENAALEALEALKQAENELGGIEAQLKSRRKDEDAIRHQIEVLKREQRRLFDAETKSKTREFRVALADRARSALAVYENRVLDQRLTALSEHFIDCFNGLIRKNRLVSSVRIDSETFEIALIGEDGAEISKDALSAGERQIFAISMLWALGKTSGRELPVIIDTPLSRLDRVHRQSMMRDYAPAASDQVILLCTDSELTEDLAELISPYVARSYEIGVSKDMRKTGIALLQTPNEEAA